MLVALFRSQAVSTFQQDPSVDKVLLNYLHLNLRYKVN